MREPSLRCPQNDLYLHRSLCAVLEARQRVPPAAEQDQPEPVGYEPRHVQRGERVQTIAEEPRCASGLRRPGENAIKKSQSVCVNSGAVRALSSKPRRSRQYTHRRYVKYTPSCRDSLPRRTEIGELPYSRQQSTLYR